VEMVLRPIATSDKVGDLGEIARGFLTHCRDRPTSPAPVTVNLEIWSTLMKAAAIPPAERSLSAAMREGSQEQHDAAEQ
jgi:hypothetical protein